MEIRIFPEDPLFPAQENTYVSPSLKLEPEVGYEWNDGSDRIIFKPFLRVDKDDDNRTHFDVRELNWFHQANNWTLLAGIGKVFWGRTEARHLVDIINQTDLVEDPDQEEKLGQLMLNLTLERSWGALDFFFMPLFRERTFPANDARLRGPAPILGAPSSFKPYGDPSYESALAWYHPDWAVRWSHTIGEFDIGVAHFRGTGREPRFLQEPQGSGGLAVRPRYDIIDQTSLDFQWTHNAWLWKLEAIGREGEGDTFGAFVGGVEYTRYQIFDSAADLGFLGEYLYDGRDVTAPPTAFENDGFVGARLALNDTQDTAVLVGAVIDLEDGTVAARVESERRLTDRLNLVLESRLFGRVDQGNILQSFRNDSFVTVRVSLFF